MPAGRPTKYDPDKFLPLIEGAALYAEEGFTDRALSKVCNVTVSSIQLWREKHPEFSGAIKELKDEMNEKVKSAMYRKAIGFESEEIKITYNADDEITKTEVTKKNYAPDTTAGIFWLKNRDPEEWRDVQHRHHTNEEQGETDILDLARKVAYLLTQGANEMNLEATATKQ